MAEKAFKAKVLKAKDERPAAVSQSFNRGAWGPAPVSPPTGGGGVAKPVRGVLKTPAGFPPKVGFDLQAWKPKHGQDTESAEPPKVD